MNHNNLFYFFFTLLLLCSTRTQTYTGHHRLDYSNTVKRKPLQFTFRNDLDESLVPRHHRELGSLRWRKMREASGRERIRKNIQALLDKTKELRKNTENTKKRMNKKKSVNIERQGFFPLVPQPLLVPSQLASLPPALVIPTVVGMVAGYCTMPCIMLYIILGLGAGLFWLLSQPQYGQSGEYEGPNTNVTSSITNNNRPTFTNTASASGTATNTNNDRDTLTNNPTNMNTATSGKRKRRK